MAQQRLVKQEASLGNLFSDLAEQTGRLIRQEAALAKSELADTAAAAGRNVGILSVGGLIGYAGFLGLMTALVAGLTYVMPLWLSALIVGAGLAIASYFLITSAIGELKKTVWAPQQTIESIKEDAQWLKNQVD
jgi:uncharacterized phage infection (PIP) family protein YhgE